MILGNFAARLCRMVIDLSDSSPEYKDTGGIVTHSLGGVSLSKALSSVGDGGNNSEPTYNGNMNTYYLCLGSGTTPPTFNDYKIESPLNMSNLTITNSTYGGSNHKYTASAVLQNTSSENFTFSEIVTAGYNGGCKVALTRDVISPVTIEPGKSKTITIVIDFASMATSVA